MSLDLSKDHGEVFGYGRAKFLQDGVYYDISGNEITMSENGYELENGVENIPVDPESEKKAKEEKLNRENLEGKSWRAIKERVIALGGEWGNKADGIDYLLSLDG